MKNVYITGFLLLAASMVNAQSVYNGNSKTGYGGVVGTGSLTISETTE